VILISCNKTRSPVAPNAVRVAPAAPASPVESVQASAAAAAEIAPGANGKIAGIRTMDVKAFVESHLGELNPDLADLDTACGDAKKPLQSLAPVLHGDLDGDGQEEAVVEGFSCLSGNGGADFRGVLKLMADQPHIPFDSLRKISAPVLVMAGDRDAIREEHTVKIFQSIPNAQLCILPGTTHYVYADRPALFNQFLFDFFDKPFTKPSTVEGALQQARQYMNKKKN